MHHHFSTYYELDRKMREKELARDLQEKYWVEQAMLANGGRRPRRLHRLRSLVAILIGFFIRA